MDRVCEWEGRFSLFSVQNAMVKRSTDCTIKVGIQASQILYLILDALNSLSGFSASAAEMDYVANVDRPL